MLVMGAHSYNTLKQPFYLSFLHSLRADYISLSPHQLDCELNELQEQTSVNVQQSLSTCGMVTVGFDSWSDQHNLPVLGWSIKTPLGPAFVHRLEPIAQSQTAEFLCEKVLTLPHISFFTFLHCRYVLWFKRFVMVE